MKLNYSRRIRRPFGPQLNTFENISDPSEVHLGNPYIQPEYKATATLTPEATAKSINIDIEACGKRRFQGRQGLTGRKQGIKKREQGTKKTQTNRTEKRKQQIGNEDRPLPVAANTDYKHTACTTDKGRSSFPIYFTRYNRCLYTVSPYLKYIAETSQIYHRDI